MMLGLCSLEMSSVCLVSPPQGCSRHQISFSYLNKTQGASCRTSLAQDSQHR